MRNRLSSGHDEGGIATHRYIWLAAALVAAASGRSVAQRSRHERGRRMKNLVRTLLVATVATLAVLAGSAVAAPPQVLHSNDSGRVQDVDFCGITTDLAFRFSQTEMLFFDKDGNI